MTYLPQSLSICYNSGAYLATTQLRCGFNEGRMYARRFVNPDDLADFLRWHAREPEAALKTMLACDGTPWPGIAEYKEPAAGFQTSIDLGDAEL